MPSKKISAEKMIPDPFIAKERYSHYNSSYGMVPRHFQDCAYWKMGKFNIGLSRFVKKIDIKFEIKI